MLKRYGVRLSVKHENLSHEILLTWNIRDLQYFAKEQALLALKVIQLWVNLHVHVATVWVQVQVFSVDTDI